MSNFLDGISDFRCHATASVGTYNFFVSQRLAVILSENKIQTCVIYVALRNGINNGQMNSKIEYDSSSRAFGTFEKHLQKVLEWKKNPDVFIKELLEQSTEDTLHEVIKQKLNLK